MEIIMLPIIIITSFLIQTIRDIVRKVILITIPKKMMEKKVLRKSC